MEKEKRKKRNLAYPSKSMFFSSLCCWATSSTITLA